MSGSGFDLGGVVASGESANNPINSAQLSRQCGVNMSLPGRLAIFAVSMSLGTAAADPPLVARMDNPPLTANRRDALVEIVEKVKGAVVNIHSERTVTPAVDDVFRSPVPSPFQMQRVNGMGTGIVLDPRGYIVTNFHVIDDIQVLKVRLVNGTQVPARVVATDKKADLAIIKVDIATPLPTVPLGTARDLFEAEQVIAIGNAFGYEHTVSIGHVAYKSRDVALNKEISYQGLIQTTAPINPGNSGGPLFNKKGELVGVNVAIRAGAQNIAFAIPVDTIGMKHGMTVRDHVSRASDEATVRRWVSIEAIDADSPAITAGLKIGDVLESIGGVAITTSIDLERGLIDLPAVATVAITAKRGNELLKTSVALAAEAKPAATVDTITRRMGLKLAPVNRDVVTRIDTQLRGGLTITDVTAGSSAAKAGLVRGDVVIGFHQWEAINLDNVHFVLNHKDLPTFNPVKTFFVRDGKVRETNLSIVD
jgi:serine protease Do